MWWLPVPRRPDTLQVSSIVTWSGANTAMRMGGGPSADGSAAAASPASMQLPYSQVGVLAAAGEPPAPA